MIKSLFILALTMGFTFFSMAALGDKPDFCEGLTPPKRSAPENQGCVTGTGTSDNNPCISNFSAAESEYKLNKQVCDEWEQKKEKADKEETDAEAEEIERLQGISDQKQTELEEAERKREEMIEEQEQLLEERKQQCQRSSDDYKRERQNVEREVIRQEDQRDQIEDQINKAQVAISQVQDEVSSSILQHRQNRRQRANKLEEQKDQQVRQAKDLITQLNNEIDQRHQALELLENKRQELYDQRYAGYTAEYTKCYDQAIEQVEKERQERQKAIEASGGVYQVRTMEEAYLSDPKIIEQYYLNRFRTLTRICFKRKTGSGTLIKRNAGVIEDSEHPFVVNIENIFKTEWQKLNMQEKATKEEIEKLLERIEDVASERSKGLKKYARESRAAEQDFNEEQNRLRVHRERKRTEKENEILSLKQRLARLHIRQPRAHFLESIELAYRDCCGQGGDQMLCRQLAAYTSDLRKTQRTRLTVNPVRKTRRSNSGSRGLQ